MLDEIKLSNMILDLKKFEINTTTEELKNNEEKTKEYLNLVNNILDYLKKVY